MGEAFGMWSVTRDFQLPHHYLLWFHQKNRRWHILGDAEEMRGSCGRASWAGLGLHLLLPHGRTEACGEINDG